MNDTADREPAGCKLGGGCSSCPPVVCQFSCEAGRLNREGDFFFVHIRTTPATFGAERVVIGHSAVKANEPRLVGSLCVLALLWEANGNSPVANL